MFKLFIGLSLFMAVGCAGIHFDDERPSGIDSGVVYSGDCVEDHFKSYFECASLQFGGPGR